MTAFSRDALVSAATRHSVVVGGANTDIVGISEASLIAHDSNPGHVRVSAGGVARNIAENLARLGCDVELVSAFGSDDAGRELAASCAAAGVGVSASLFSSELPGARYLAIVDDHHDMALALSDMRVLDLLTPSCLADPERAALLAAAELVVVDANLSPATLERLVGSTGGLVVADAVSASKAPHLAGVLPALGAVKCTALEAAALLGQHVPVSDAQVEYVSEKLCAAGVGVAVVSAGARGTHWRGGGEHGWVAAPRARIVNTTGAGDAFVAGLALGLLAGFGARVATELGSALSAIALEDEATVSDAVSLDNVVRRAEEIIG